MSLLNCSLLRLLLLLPALAAVAPAQTGTFSSTSMASYGPLVSPDSIAAGFGTNLATGTTAISGFPLPTALGGAQVSITDSAGTKVASPLYMVSATQINYLVPSTLALGKATVTVTTGSNTVTGTLLISNVAPAIATANSSGQGVPAAQVVRTTAGGITSIQVPYMMSGSTYTTNPISLAMATDSVYLMLYGTGIRRHSLNPVKVSIGGISVPVTYAGVQSQYPGLDQVNVGPLPQTLVGKGQVNLLLTVDGVPANPVVLAFQ